MLSVKTNMLALNANRQLGLVTKKNAKNTERLSSGYPSTELLMMRPVYLSPRKCADKCGALRRLH